MTIQLTAPRVIDTAVRRLQAAASRAEPGQPIRDLIGPANLAAAYEVQKRLTEARVAAGAAIVGRKVGLTSPAVQEQLGVDQPDFGILFDDMAYASGDTIPGSAVLQPRAEAEVAFVLAEDLATGTIDAERARGAIDHAVAAIEVCGSRIANWDISFADTVADNASAGVYVLGTERRGLEEFEPRDALMTMTIDGEVVSRGAGSACLGDPINAVVWLAEKAREFGEPLRAGQVILSGALGPMRPIAPGNTVCSTVSGLGTVTFSLGSES